MPSDPAKKTSDQADRQVTPETAPLRDVLGDGEPHDVGGPDDPTVSAAAEVTETDALAAGLPPAEEGRPEAATSPAATAELQAELNAARDRQLRLHAELENVRKRMTRTLEEERRYACLPLARDLLPVVDNLERAIQAAEQQEHAAALLEGVRLVAAQLTDVLRRHHCVTIEAQGALFDPHLHEAIAQLPSPDTEPGHVSLVTQTGYQLHDRVIRPAQVIVAAPRSEAAESPAEPNE